MSAGQLLELLQQCMAYNPPNGITGLLLYGNGTFLQALEGEDEAVTKLYDIIEHDERHVDVRCVHRKTIEHRQYPDWSMGFRRMTAAQTQNIEGLRDFKKDDFNPDFLAENDAMREELMSHYAYWDPLVREVDKKDRHVRHLEEALRRTEGGNEIARLVLESIVDAHASNSFGAPHERMCTFALDQLGKV